MSYINTQERLIKELNDLNLRIHRLCNQVELLNDQLHQLNFRYQHAVKTNNNAFRYVIRLRILSFETVRTTIMQRARTHSKRMDHIEDILNQRQVV